MTEDTYSDAKLKLRKEVLAILLKKYGHENIASDDRDFIQESLEEVLDCMVYASCKLIEIKEKNEKTIFSNERSRNILK